MTPSLPHAPDPHGSEESLAEPAGREAATLRVPSAPAGTIPVGGRNGSPPGPEFLPEVTLALRRFLLWVGVSTAAFGSAWLQLCRDAWKDELHSYAVAIPVVCAWIAWQERAQWSRLAVRPGRGPAIGLALAAVAAWLGARSPEAGSGGWQLTLGMTGWLLAVWAGFIACLGLVWVRRLAFSFAFLLFVIPFPPVMVHAIEMGLQYSTAWTVDLAFRIGGITFSRDAKTFWLPGLRFEVAQECSGIRSSLVLFITSLVGAKLLLESALRRGLLALAVIPLGIARNAFRICVITLLSVYVDPRIIDSPLHHRGGPLFFLLSLVPLFLLLWWFRRQEAAPPGHKDQAGLPQKAP